MAGFGFGGGGFANMAGAPQALQMAYYRDPRMALANQLQAMGGDTSPVQSHLQGAGRLAQALLGVYTRNKVDNEYAKQAEAYQNDMRALYAPVQELTPGADGRMGPTNTASMTTRPANMQEMVGRIGNLQSPYALQEARGIQQFAMQQQAAEEAKRRDPMYGRTVVRDVGLVDMRGPTPRVEIPIPQKPDEFERLAAAAGLKPGTPEFAAAARSIIDRRGMPPQTTVNNTIEPPKFETELQKTDAKRIAEYEDAVQKARGLLPDLDRLEAAIRVYPTGIGGGNALAFRQAMERIGIPIQGTSEGEVIQAIQSRLAPAMRPVGSGSSSDRDTQMFMDALPNLFRSPGGNMAIIRHMRHITQRQQQEAGFMRNYLQKNGSLGGVYEAMDKELGPVFPRVGTPDEAEKLAPGSLFIDPTGVMRVR